MQGKNKVYIRNIQNDLANAVKKRQSVLILGPRQVGKTTLVSSLLSGVI
jgi:predicted AAA+ superfamily ATPase